MRLQRPKIRGEPRQRVAALLLGVALVSTSPAAGPNDELTLVPLQNGINSVDLDADGKPEVVVVGQRENFNAHGFSVTTIYLKTAAQEGEQPQLHIVPLLQRDEDKEEEEKRERLTLETRGGAECLLHDFRLLIDRPRKRAVVVTGDRDLGKGFGDARPVVFRYYALARNKEGIPGWPVVYFESYKTTRTTKAYCDIGEAFEKELAIASDGRSDGSGARNR